MKRTLLNLLAVGTIAGAGSASASVEFFLANNSLSYGGSTLEQLDEVDTMVLPLSGIITTLEGNNSNDADVVLNATSSNFGINTDGSGDETSQLDGDLGDESVTLSFDTTVVFSKINVSLLGSSDSGSITFSNGAAQVDFEDSGDVAAGDITLLPGETVTVSHVAGNGFSFESFTVSTPTVIPTPTASVLAALALGGIAARRRRNG